MISSHSVVSLGVKPKDPTSPFSAHSWGDMKPLPAPSSGSGQRTSRLQTFYHARTMRTIPVRQTFADTYRSKVRTVTLIPFIS
jgi:hypothetical protein